MNLTKINLSIEKKTIETRGRSNTIVNRLKELDVGYSETSELIISYFGINVSLSKRSCVKIGWKKTKKWIM